MNQQEILKKIGSIIAELQDQYNYLENGDGELNQLELELFKANATFLTDHVEILKKITSQRATATLSKEPNSIKERSFEERAAVPDYFDNEDFTSLSNKPAVDIDEGTIDDKSAEKPESNTVFITNTMDSYQTEDVNTTSALPEKEPVKEALPAEKQPAAAAEKDKDFTLPEVLDSTNNHDFPVAKEQPVSVKIPPVAQQTATDSLVRDRELPPQIEAPVQPQISFQPEVQTTESFSISKSADTTETPLRTESGQEPALTLNQQIAAQNNKIHPSTKVINPGGAMPDLQALISLNDKLLFVRELFNGYNLAYAEAVNILNRYTSLEQSEKFLKSNYAEKNSWQDKPATTERFYELLKKRFGG